MYAVISSNVPWEKRKTSVAELQEVETGKSRFHMSALLGFFQESGLLLAESRPLFEPQVQSISILVEIEQLLRSLSQYVHLRRPHEIREYLVQFPNLMDVIPAAVDAAYRHFPEAQLIMDVYRDPEIEDRYLILYVRLNQYDESIVERLEKAEAEFLNQLVDKEGWLQLTTDFQEPEAEDEF